jgi:hypothetical protein
MSARDSTIAEHHGKWIQTSRGWTDRFMKQNNLSLWRASLCQKLPSEFTKSSLFTTM